MVRFGADLSGFQQGLQTMQTSLATASAGMQAAGASMSAALTAPIMGVGAVAAKSAMEAQDAQARLQAQLGVTATEAQKLGETARTVWKAGFGESLADVNTSLGTVKQNMKGLSETDLQSVTKAAYTLQDVFGAEITESTAAAGVMMKQFGIDGQTAMDLITVGFQRGGDFSGELLDTLREYAPQFKSLGLNAEESMAILLKGTEAGAFNLDKVGDAMKEFNIRTKDGSKLTADSFKALGMNADEMAQKLAAGGEEGKKALFAVMTAIAGIEDPMKRNTVGVGLFGTQWEDLESKVISSMATAQGGLENVEGAAQRAGEAMHATFSEQLQVAWRGLQDALIPLGSVLLQLAQQWLPPVIAAIASVASMFAGLSPAVQGVILVIAGIAAVIGPVIIGLGAFSAALAAISSPVLAAVAVIAGLGVAFAGIWAAWQTYGGQLIAGWESFKSQAANTWKSITDGISSTVQKGWDAIVAATTKFLDSVKQKVIDFSTQFSGLWTKVKDGATVIWQALWTAVTAAAGEAWGKVKVPLTTLASSISNWFTGVKDTGSRIFTELWDALSSLVASAWSTYIGQPFESVKTSIGQWFTKLQADGKKWFQDFWTALKTIASSAWGTYVSEPFQSLWNSISAWFIDLGTSARQWGQNLISMFAAGIRSGIGWVRDAVDSVAKTVEDFIGFHSPTEKGPASDSDTWAPNLLKMFADGMLANVDKVERSAKTVADAIKQPFNNLDQFAADATAGMVQSARAGVAIARDELDRAFSTLDASPSVRVSANLAQGAATVRGASTQTAIDYDRLAQAVARNNKPSVTMNNTFASADLTASEARRKQEQLLRQLALEWR